MSLSYNKVQEVLVLQGLATAAHEELRQQEVMLKALLERDVALREELALSLGDADRGEVGGLVVTRLSIDSVTIEQMSEYRSGDGD